MQRDVSYVNVVSTFRLVASSRSLVTTMRFSGQASAHRLQEMHNVSPLSGLMLSRGAPRYRSATLGRSDGYCSVQIYFGFWLRNVTQRPCNKSTKKTDLRNLPIILSVHFSQDDVKRADDRHHVSHQAAADHSVERLQIDKGRRP